MGVDGQQMATGACCEVELAVEIGSRGVGHLDADGGPVSGLIEGPVINHPPDEGAAQDTGMGGPGHAQQQGRGGQCLFHQSSSSI